MQFAFYGIGEWAALHAPNLLGLSAKEIKYLNDDRMGRALDRLFLADGPSLALAVAATVVRELNVSLDELHNDSTTVSFVGVHAIHRPARRKVHQRLVAKSG